MLVKTYFSCQIFKNCMCSLSSVSHFTFLSSPWPGSWTTGESKLESRPRLTKKHHHTHLLGESIHGRHSSEKYMLPVCKINFSSCPLLFLYLPSFDISSEDYKVSNNLHKVRDTLCPISSGALEGHNGIPNWSTPLLTVFLSTGRKENIRGGWVCKIFHYI